MEGSAACQRHQDDLKDGDKRGLYFDEEGGQRFVAFFERFLHHSRGQWAGQPCTLLPWQQFMISQSMLLSFHLFSKVMIQFRISR